MLPDRVKNSTFYQKNKYRLARAADVLSFAGALCALLFLSGDQSQLSLKRHALSSEIAITAMLTGVHSGVFEIDDKVIRAMARVPRHQYIHQPYSEFAYFNVALPVDGQEYMVPEPFITAMMVHLMDIEKTDNVLEIGFGAGYDAAVIAQLAGTVHSISQVEPLTKPEEEAGGKKYDNVVMRHGDGAFGWAETGPYDSILVRQSMREPPLALLRQLKPGGRLVMPIGAPGETQRLTVYTRTGDGIEKRPTLHMKISPLLKGDEI